MWDWETVGGEEARIRGAGGGSKMLRVALRVCVAYNNLLNSICRLKPPWERRGKMKSRGKIRPRGNQQLSIAVDYLLSHCVYLKGCSVLTFNWNSFDAYFLEEGEKRSKYHRKHDRRGVNIELGEKNEMRWTFVWWCFHMSELLKHPNWEEITVSLISRYSFAPKKKTATTKESCANALFLSKGRIGWSTDGEIRAAMCTLYCFCPREDRAELKTETDDFTSQSYTFQPSFRGARAVNSD